MFVVLRVKICSIPKNSNIQNIPIPTGSLDEHKKEQVQE